MHTTKRTLSYALLRSAMRLHNFAHTFNLQNTEKPLFPPVTRELFKEIKSLAAIRLFTR